LVQAVHLLSQKELEVILELKRQHLVKLLLVVEVVEQGEVLELVLVCLADLVVVLDMVVLAEMMLPDQQLVLLVELQMQYLRQQDGVEQVEHLVEMVLMVVLVAVELEVLEALVVQMVLQMVDQDCSLLLLDLQHSRVLVH